MKPCRFRPLVSFFLSFLCLITVSCSAEGGNSQEATDIRVVKTNPINYIPGITEEFPLPNCGGNRELAQTLGSQSSIQKTVSVAGTATLRGSQEKQVVVPKLIRSKLEAEISIAYSDIFQNENSRLDSIELKAAPASHVVYILQWVDEQYISTVSYFLEGNTYDADYIYTLRVPKLSNSYSIGCASLNPDQSPVPSPVQPTISSSLSSSPIEISAFCAKSGKPPIYAKAGQEVILKWGWIAKTDAYRQDYIDSVAFSLQLDGRELDTSSASITLTLNDAGEYLAVWRMPPTVLSEGTHQVTITQILNREVMDGWDNDNNGSIDIFEPGRSTVPPCEIIVE